MFPGLLISERWQRDLVASLFFLQKKACTCAPIGVPGHARLWREYCWANFRRPHLKVGELQGLSYSARCPRPLCRPPPARPTTNINMVLKLHQTIVLPRRSDICKHTEK